MFSLHGELGIRDDFVEGTEIWLYLRTFDDYECETVSPLYRNGVKKNAGKCLAKADWLLPGQAHILVQQFLCT